MGIIVVEETRRQVSEDFGPGEVVAYNGAVHAAPADSSVPGDPADTTLRNKPTRGMEKLSYTPAGARLPLVPTEQTPVGLPRLRRGAAFRLNDHQRGTGRSTARARAPSIPHAAWARRLVMPAGPGRANPSRACGCA